MLDILDLCIPWGSLVLIDEVRGSTCASRGAASCSSTRCVAQAHGKSDAGLWPAMKATWPYSITYYAAGGDAARETDEE